MRGEAWGEGQVVVKWEREKGSGKNKRDGKKII